MDTTAVRRHWYTPRPLAALGKVSAAALAGLTFLLGYIIVQFGFFPPLLIFMAAALVLAGIVAMGWRWAPLLGVLVYGAFLAFIGPFVPDIVSHPSDSFTFTLVVALLALAVVGIGAGLGATIQNYRSAERRTPRGLEAMLVGLVGLAAGAILVANIPQPGINSGVSPEMLAALPAVTTKDFAFAEKVVRAKVGESVALRLDNRDTTGHSFDIDELGIHVPMVPGKSGLALFRPTRAGGYTFYCGVPGHYNKETGDGMVGTLIVE